ncbi:MAG: lactate utilization protein [Clostridia bacterium]|nr:lactate utilization protein [Clostridia bacterium]
MTPKQQTYELLANTIIKGLKKRQMEGYYAPDKEAAVQLALSLMPAGSSIAWGGSMSLSESGLMAALSPDTYDIIDRDKASSPEEREALKARIVNADYFLMSTNAITMDGELINIDGHGTRLSFLIYGPKHVIVLAGMNKVAPDRAAAEARARNLASPANSVRLHRNTPCALTGRCQDCYSPDCICSQFVYTRRSSIPGRIKVILVGEELGY